MDLVYAMLIVLGLRHPAPVQYHTPVKALPLVIEHEPLILDSWEWGPCR